ncbi:hypothetical protein IC582_026201 [Cucumis melo]
MAFNTIARMIQDFDAIVNKFFQNPLKQRSYICGNSLMYRHFCRFDRKNSGLNVVI